MTTKLLSWPSLHQGKLAIIMLLAVLLSVSAVCAGDTKAIADIDLFDVVGEGAASLMALFWLWLLLISRPCGKVTNLFIVGTGCYWLTTLLDLIDEFIHYPDSMRLFAWLESIPVPISMVLVTMGLLQWLAEQQAINRQLQQREHFQREHQLIDPVTQLYNGHYCLLQLQRLADCHDLQQQPLAVIMVDIQSFASYNRQHGMAAGDVALRQLAGALECCLRPQDQVCRWASDRFVLLLQNTPENVAQMMIRHLQSCALPLRLQAVTLSRQPKESAAALLQRLSAQLGWYKRSETPCDGVA